MIKKLLDKLVKYHKKLILYDKIKTKDYNIISFEKITVKQKDMIKEMFNKAKSFLNQINLQSKFTIKLIYNQNAFDGYSIRNSKSSIYRNGVTTLAFYLYNKKEIVIPIYNFTENSLGHEMIHAIVHINKLKESDSESLAYKFGDMFKKPNIIVTI